MFTGKQKNTAARVVRVEMARSQRGGPASDQRTAVHCSHRIGSPFSAWRVHLKGRERSFLLTVSLFPLSPSSVMV